MKARPLYGPLALACWIMSLAVPAMSAPQGWVAGWEFVAKSVVAGPLALFIAPMLVLMPYTNIVFGVQLYRLWASGLPRAEPPHAGWIAGSLLYIGLVLAMDHASAKSALGPVGHYPALWLWLSSFVLLARGILRGEASPLDAAERRWRLAAVGAGAVLALSIAVPRVLFPKETTFDTAEGVERIEVRRIGHAPAQLPLLANEHLFRSAYASFVENGRTYERTPGGSWIARDTALPARYVVHEQVEASEDDHGRPGAVVRATLTVRDRASGQVMARKTLYEGMEEKGHGWLGQIGLDFVQKTLQPASRMHTERASIAVRPLAIGEALAAESTRKPSSLRCPEHVAVDLRRAYVRTARWQLTPQGKVVGVACAADSVLVVSTWFKTVHVDVLAADGEVVAQGQFELWHAMQNRYLHLADARAEVGGWQMRLMSWVPGRSTRDGVVVVDHFEARIHVGH